MSMDLAQAHQQFQPNRRPADRKSQRENIRIQHLMEHQERMLLQQRRQQQHREEQERLVSASKCLVITLFADVLLCLSSRFT
jgi:hypothetical protein